MLVPDGAYTFELGRPHFHRIPAPSHDDLQRLLSTLIQRITRTLVRAGALIEDPLPGEAAQPYLDLEPDGPLDELTAAAVHYRIVLGPKARAKDHDLARPQDGGGDST